MSDAPTPTGDDVFEIAGPPLFVESRLLALRVRLERRELRAVGVEHLSFTADGRPTRARVTLTKCPPLKTATT